MSDPMSEEEVFILPLRDRPAYTPSKRYTEDPFEVVSEASHSAPPLIGHIFGPPSSVGRNEALLRKRRERRKRRRRLERLMKRRKLATVHEGAQERRTVYHRTGKRTYIHGEHDMYYGDRYKQFAEIDERLKWVIEKFGRNVFAQKKICDIGCGSGFVAFYIATFLGAGYVVASDRDSEMILTNLKQLRKFKHEGVPVEIGARLSGDTDYPALVVRRSGPVRITNKIWRIHDEFTSDLLVEEKRFPFNIEFRVEDAVFPHHNPFEIFDVVWCTRVSEYVLQAYGELGLSRLVDRLVGMVAEGGILILQDKTGLLVKELGERFKLEHDLGRRLLVFRKT